MREVVGSIPTATTISNNAKNIRHSESCTLQLTAVATQSIFFTMCARLQSDLPQELLFLNLRVDLKRTSVNR